MKKPIILLTSQHDDRDDKVSLRFSYTDAVIESGGVPFALTLSDNDEYIKDALACADGLMLTGGDDVAPELYGDVRTDKCGPVSPMRDKFEINSVKAAVEMKLPVLGICRGIQVMNVAMGGTLFEDIARHKQNKPYHEPHHAVSVTSPLSKIYPKSAWVNSFHHQAINRVAPELEVCAVSEDGCVEAVYLPSHPFFLGVQWHPERMVKNDASALKLFDEFVHQCCVYSDKK